MLPSTFSQQTEWIAGWWSMGKQKNPRKIKPIQERFEGKVMRSSECHIWTGAFNNKGYGVFMDGKAKLAHRVSYEIHTGVIPDGACVLHKCDTPLCVNPDHLFLGTQQENIADMVSKHRTAIGENHSQSKLSIIQVYEIRSDKRSQRVIALDYPVSRAAVGQIQRGETWGHLPERISA